jgi:Tfp pilus assembly protein PilO
MFLWSPKGRELDEAREREDVAVEQAMQLESRLARLRATQERSTELIAALDQLRAAVPEVPNLAQFILDTNDAALQAGVAFLSVAPSPPQLSTPGLPAQINVSLSIDGGYFQVLDFVNRLDSMARIVVVDTFSVSPKAQDGSAPQLSVSLGGRMFTTSLSQDGGTAAGATDGSSAPASPAATPAETPPADSTSPSTSVVGAVR